MDDDSSQREEKLREEDKYLSKRLTIPSLILPVFVVYIPQLIISLLLIEITHSFDIEVGVAGQLSTVASIVSAIMALVMGVLSVRYRHKTLLITGLVTLCISTLGCYLTPNFVLLLVVFSLTGISMAMVQPMSTALIGPLFSVKERPKVISYLIAGMASSYVIGSPIINGINDWRIVCIFFLFPLTLVSIFLAILGVPSTSSSNPSSQRFLQGFKEVLRNKSAIACVVANILFIMPFREASFYGIQFYRQQFLVDKTFTTLIVSSVALVFVAGSLISGRLIGRFGRKKLTVICAFITGVLVFAFINVPSLWLSLVLWFASGVTGSMRNTAYNSLALEQVPEYRGTMMSLSQFSANVAMALGNGLGGLILIVFDYRHMGALGIAAIIASLIFHFFTIDPTQQTKH
jgi:predicted MFS family arabinose efflux permease